MADSAAFIAVAQPGSENGFSSVFNTPIIVFIGATVFYVVTLAKAFRSRTRRAKVGWSIGAVFLALICTLSIVAWLYRGSSALDERVASAINALAKRFNSKANADTVQRSPPATSKTAAPDQRVTTPIQQSGEDQALNLPALARKARSAVSGSSRRNASPAGLHIVSINLSSSACPPGMSGSHPK